jgi:two-component system response regulator WspF
MRIAIVNDLALARATLQRLVESVPGYTVAWMAADGAEAVRRAAADTPDVILMDLIMPCLDGAAATRRIMAATPCPILIVTASVGSNIGKVYEALGAGGLDAVRTPVLGADGKVCGGAALLERLARLARPRPATAATAPAAVRTPTVSVPASSLPPLLALGASTGGPEAVGQVLSALRPRPPGPVVVVQHIAPDFAGGFVCWLQERTGLDVCLAAEKAEPESGLVHVAASDDHLVLEATRCFGYRQEPRDYLHRPSVDVLFESLAAWWPGPGVAVLLTGMGSDGARGLLELRKRGWHTIAQDEATSVVYGMPRAAVACNAAVQVLPLSQIGLIVRARLHALERARCCGR